MRDRDDRRPPKRRYPSFYEKAVPIALVIIVVAIVILLSETNKARPFQRFHAAQALAFWVVLGAITFVLCIVTAVVGILCFPVLWLISLWPAYQAYQGEYIELPLVTDFLRKQGWV